MDGKSHKQREQCPQRSISSLRWHAARMGPSTTYTSLSLDISIYTRLHSPKGENSIIKAFRKGVFVQDLRVLTARLHGLCAESQALDAFLGWLLEQASGLEAMSLCRDSAFCLLGTRMGCLKHLELQSFRSVDLSPLSLAQMPILETLCINGVDKQTTAFTVDVTACSHLRQLALKRTVVQRLVRRPSCRLSCHTDFMCAHHQSDVWTSHMRTVLNSAEHIELYCSDGAFSPSARGIFASLPDVKVLTMSGQGLDNETLLPKCMPMDGLQVERLRILRLNADAIKCCIPAGLLNLEELFVMAKQELLLKFEDLGVTFRTLKLFYAFGNPQGSTEYDLLFRTLPILVKRGLCIETVEGDTDGKHVSSNSKCLYLGPLKGEQLSMRALYKIVSWFARECKCGACFTCLRAAGSVK